MTKNPVFHQLKHKKDDTVYFRNIWCGEYDGCLTTAAFSNWHLDCSRCAMKANKSDTFVLGDREIDGCMSLLCNIFKSDSPCPI